MIPNFKQAEKFNRWMLKIKHIDYSDNEKMLAAFKRIAPLTADRAIIEYKIRPKTTTSMLYI